MFNRLMNYFKSKNEIPVIQYSFITGLKNLELYFHNQVTNYNQFTANYETIQEINEILHDKRLNTENFRNLENKYNGANKKDTDKGSGWLDVKMHLSGLAKENNFHCEWYKNNDIRFIKPDYNSENYKYIELVSECYKDNKINYVNRFKSLGWNVSKLGINKRKMVSNYANLEFEWSHKFIINGRIDVNEIEHFTRLIDELEIHYTLSINGEKTKERNSL